MDTIRENWKNEALLSWDRKMKDCYRPQSSQRPNLTVHSQPLAVALTNCVADDDE